MMPNLSPAEKAARKKERGHRSYLANREQVLARHKERRSDPEVKARESERARGYCETNRERIRAREKLYYARPDVKARRAELARRRAQDPDGQASLTAARHRYNANHPDRQREASKRWCLVHPEKKAQCGRAGTAKLRARRYGVPVEAVNYLMIVERDKGICQICGQPIDFQAPPRSSFSPSWDHIIPFSQGGAHTESNVQLAHLSCNIRKSNRERRSGATGAGAVG